MPFPVFDTLEAVPEAFREEYEQGEDGKYVAKAPAAEDVTPLKTALAAERKRADTAEKAAKAAEAAKGAAEREAQALKTQIGDPEAKTKALLEKFEEDIKAAVAGKDADIERLTGELRTIRLDDKVKAEFIRAGGRPERADAALTLYKHRTDLADDRIVVKDAKGDVSTATIGDFWSKEVRGEMPELFSGTKAGGGAGNGGTPGSGAASSGTLSWDAIAANPGAALDAANATA